MSVCPKSALPLPHLCPASIPNHHPVKPWASLFIPHTSHTPSLSVMDSELMHIDDQIHWVCQYTEILKSWIQQIFCKLCWHLNLLHLGVHIWVGWWKWSGSTKEGSELGGAPTLSATMSAPSYPLFLGCHEETVGPLLVFQVSLTQNLCNQF